MFCSQRKIQIMVISGSKSLTRRSRAVLAPVLQRILPAPLLTPPRLHHRRSAPLVSLQNAARGRACPR